MTFSGGEPLTYGAYLEQIARKCRENRIDVCIESCGYSPLTVLRRRCPTSIRCSWTSKSSIRRNTREATGRSNQLILDNIRRISEYGVPLTIRTPIVPGYTDTEENIRGIAEFVSGLDTVTEYELLRYHNFGESKYAALGRPMI